jgi:hypothetical protein
VYRCHKNAQGFTSLSGSIFSSLKKQLEEIDKSPEIVDKIELGDFELGSTDK